MQTPGGAVEHASLHGSYTAGGYGDCGYELCV